LHSCDDVAIVVRDMIMDRERHIIAGGVAGLLATLPAVAWAEVCDKVTAPLNAWIWGGIAAVVVLGLGLAAWRPLLGCISVALLLLFAALVGFSDADIARLAAVEGCSGGAYVPVLSSVVGALVVGAGMLLSYARRVKRSPSS
jgi:hypothetical protein